MGNSNRKRIKLRFSTDDSNKSLAPFFSPPIISATVSGLVIVGGLVILFWPREPLFFYISLGRKPLLFFLAFTAALIIHSYLNLRCGRGELMKTNITHRFQKDESVVEKETHFLRYGLIVFLIHTLFMLLPFSPILLLASAVSGISLFKFIQALSILLTAALLSRFFGFLVYLHWGRFGNVGYLLIRGFAVFYLFITAGFLPLFNPLRILYELNKNDTYSESYLYYMIATLLLMLIFVSMSTLMVSRHIKMGNKI